MYHYLRISVLLSMETLHPFKILVAVYQTAFQKAIIYIKLI